MSCWKEAFATPQQAMQSCISRKGKRLHSYQCPHCSLWHLSSKPNDPKYRQFHIAALKRARKIT